MKKKMVLVGAMLIVSTIIFAQGHRGDSKKHADKSADRMKKELSLNDDQYSRVKAINEGFMEKGRKLRADTAVTVGYARTQSKKLMQSRQEELKSVLTADQWSRWEALKKKHQEDRKKKWSDKMGKG